MCDPLQESRKAVLQLSPRVSQSSSTTIATPKLYSIGTNHSRTVASDVSHGRQKGFTLHDSVPLDPYSGSVSNRNSLRPTVSPRDGLGMLPREGNPQVSTRQWLEKAGKVCRYFAYFTEEALFSPGEPSNARTRTVQIMFYLTDGSIELTETKVSNSGIQGGSFLSRAHVPNESRGGATFILSDFAVGKVVKIFGRSFTVYDADGFTRSLTGDDAPKLAVPGDDFLTIRKLNDPNGNTPKKPKDGANRTAGGTPRKNKWLRETRNITEERMAATSSPRAKREARMRGEVAEELPEEKERTSILRFFCEMIEVEDQDGGDGGGDGDGDGKSNGDGQKEKSRGSSHVRGPGDSEAALYKIHFYLEDGTLEVLVSNAKSLCYAIYPVLLNRCLCPRSLTADVTRIGFDSNDDQYVDEEDLRVGSIVNIANRKMRIYKADERTYKWMEENKGVDMRPDETEPTPPPEESWKKPSEPQVDEDGNEIQDLGYFDDLAPHSDQNQKKSDNISAKEQFFKQAHLSGKILRFRAFVPLDKRHPADVDQVFVVSYYLADDTISVFVRSPPNSGLTSGQYLRRGRHKNLNTGHPFTPDDLYQGARLIFRSLTLEIDAVDDYSKNYTHMTTEEILGLVRQKVNEKGINIHEVFRLYDEDKSQGLSYQEFHDALRGSNFNLDDLLSQRDIMTLFRQFDRDGSGQIAYLEFCAGVQEADVFNSTMDRNLVNPDEAFVMKSMNEDEVEDYIHRIHQNELDGRKERDLEEAMGKFIQFVSSHRDAGHMANLFMDFDDNGDGSISMEEFGNVLTDKIHLSRRDVDIIKLKFFPFDCEKIQFDNFVKVLKAYTDAKKKGKFLGRYKPPTMKGSLNGSTMKGLLG